MKDNISLVNSLKESAKSYIINNLSRFCFKIGIYDVPIRIRSSNNNIINLKINRDKLLKSNSLYSRRLENYLTSEGIVFIREFIIIIQNKELWEYSVNCMDISDSEKEIYKKMNYFSLDYFLPINMTCIEVDSDYHINRKSLDFARDIYLRMTYFIKTIRFYHFGENYIRDKNNIDLLKKRLSEVNIDPRNRFNYLDIIYDEFVYDNEYLFIMLSRFIEFIGYENLYKSTGKILITEKDFNTLAYNINFGNNTYPMMFCDDFIDLAKNIINYDIVIMKHVTSYSIIEINYILENSKNIQPLFRKIISKYNNIPYWVSKILNLSDRYKKLIAKSNYEDIEIMKYIKLTSEKPLNS